RTGGVLRQADFILEELEVDVTGPAGVLPFYASVEDQMTIASGLHVGIGIGDIILGRHAGGAPSPVRNRVLVLVAWPSGVDGSVGGAASRDVVLDEGPVAVEGTRYKRGGIVREDVRPVRPVG